MIKTIKIRNETYQTNTEFWIGGTEKEFIKKAKTEGQDLIEDGTKGMCFQVRDKNSPKILKWIIWLGSEIKTIEGRGIAVHEMIHLVFDVLSYKNVRPIMGDDDIFMGTTQEPYAYLMEYFYTEVFKRLK